MINDWDELDIVGLSDSQRNMLYRCKKLHESKLDEILELMKNIDKYRLEINDDIHWTDFWRVRSRIEEMRNGKK